MAKKSYLQKDVDFYEALRQDSNREAYIFNGDARFAHKNLDPKMSRGGGGGGGFPGMGGGGGFGGIMMDSDRDIAARRAEYDEYIANNPNAIAMSSATENTENVNAMRDAEKRSKGRAADLLTGGQGLTGPVNLASRVLKGA